MGVVIAHNSRNYSRTFALEAANVICANGIKTYLFDSLRPTTELSFALAVGELSELVLELQIFDIISLKASGICSIFPAFLPHSIIKFANSKIL